MKKKYYQDKWYLKNITHKKNKGKLNKQHYDFIYYYCLTNNAYRSAVNAGYSESYAHRKGKELLENKKIMELIIEQKNEMIKQNGIIPQDIVRKYIDIAFADIGNYIEIENGMIDIKDSKNLDYSLIKKISRDKQGTTIELENKQNALKWLAEYFKIDPEFNLKAKRVEEGEKNINFNHNTSEEELDIEKWMETLENKVLENKTAKELKEMFDNK